MALGIRNFEKPGPIGAPWPAQWGAERECRHCGRGFYRIRTANTYYCSDKCAYAAHLAAVVKSRSKGRAAARADRKCEVCGKPLTAQRWTMRFCSVRCRVAAHRVR
jgi:endogenous inhibitor of DNA gyrase (YacG/DUF329 family)